LDAFISIFVCVFRASQSNEDSVFEVAVFEFTLDFSATATVLLVVYEGALVLALLLDVVLFEVAGELAPAVLLAFVELAFVGLALARLLPLPALLTLSERSDVLGPISIREFPLPTLLVLLDLALERSAIRILDFSHFHRIVVLVKVDAVLGQLVVFELRDSVATSQSLLERAVECLLDCFFVFDKRCVVVLA